MATSRIERSGTGGGGGGATDLPSLTDVDNALVYTSGHVLRANGTQFTNAQLAHSDLSGTGTNTHAQIDSHIANTSNPHSVTTTQIGAVATTGDETIAGVKTFSSVPKTTGGNPTVDNDLVRKAYVDSIAQGLEPKAACRVATTTAGTLATDFENGDTVDGVVLATGDRILIKDQADQTTNGIYTVNASGAPTRATDYDTSAEVQEGTFTFVSSGTANAGKQFVQLTVDPTLGSSNLVFSQLSGGTTYTAGAGLDLTSTEFSVDLKANDGLAIKSTELGVDYDDSTIGIVTNKLAVKDGGITNDKIDTVAASKLTGQVALANGGTGLSGAGTANYVLGMDSAGTGLEYKQLIEGSNITITHGNDSVTIASSGGGGGGGGTTILDVDLLSDPQTAIAWTNMPNATTELYGTTTGRVKVDLSNASQYRIVVNQSVAGASGADLNLQYSTDNTTYVSAESGSAGELDVGTGTGVKVGAWTDLVSGAKADVWLRLVGKQGNGSADPAFRQIRIQFKILAGAPNTSAFVTIGTDSTLTAERALTQVANETLITDNGAGSTVTVGLSSTVDLGGKTSFEIPNSAGGGTIDAAGEIGVDTTSGTLNFHNGTGERVLNPIQSKSFVLESPAATDDMPLWRTDVAITLTEVHYLCIGGTNWVGQLQECDANGINGANVHSADITASAGTDNGTTTFSNASIDAGDWVGVKTTSISGTPTRLHITWYYYENP